MTREQVLTHTKDKNLKSKLYWPENLPLSKLSEVVIPLRSTTYYFSEVVGSIMIRMP